MPPKCSLTLPLLIYGILLDHSLDNTQYPLSKQAHSGITTTVCSPRRGGVASVVNKSLVHMERAVSNLGFIVHNPAWRMQMKLLNYLRHVTCAGTLAKKYSSATVDAPIRLGCGPSKPPLWVWEAPARPLLQHPPAPAISAHGLLSC